MVFESLFQNTTTPKSGNDTVMNNSGSTEDTEITNNTNNASSSSIVEDGGKGTSSSSSINMTNTKKRKRNRKQKKRSNNNNNNANKKKQPHIEQPVVASSNDDDHTTTTTNKEDDHPSSKPTTPTPTTTPIISLETKRDFSRQLQTLSSQKRITEILSIYHHPSNAPIRDAHHACIVVDCCARCGCIEEEGEGIVRELIRGLELVATQQQQQRRNPGGGRRKNLVLPRQYVSVQTNTALLKGYAHSGLMGKACSLYGWMEEAPNRRDRPNVRSLNTFLRGCLWTAAGMMLSPSNTEYEYGGGGGGGSEEGINRVMMGGVISCEQFWPSPCSRRSRNISTQKRIGSARGGGNSRGDDISNDISLDLSSYEYSITLLCQSLRCNEAIARLQKMRDAFGITLTMRQPQSMDGNGNITTTNNNNNNERRERIFTADDPSAIETLAASFSSLARAHSLLGEFDHAQRYATSAIDAVDSVSSNHNNMHNHNHNNANIATATGGTGSSAIAAERKGGGKGGKRAWHPNTSFTDHTIIPNNNNNTNNNESRRFISNSLFRTHKLSTLRSDANATLHHAMGSIMDEKQRKKEEGNTKKKNRRQQPQSNNRNDVVEHLAFQLVTRLLYFSGGGTTSLSKTGGGRNGSSSSSSTDKKDDTNSSGGGAETKARTTTTAAAANKAKLDDSCQYERKRLINSLWYSFGLSQALRAAYRDDVTSIPSSSSLRDDTTAKTMATTTGVLNDDDCRRVIELAMGGGGRVVQDDDAKEEDENGYYAVIDKDGYVDFSHVFASRTDDHKKTHKHTIGNGDDDNIIQSDSTTNTTKIIKVLPTTAPLNIELGSGFGEWIVHQARSNPSSNYVAVELRSDRIAQTFSKAFLNIHTTTDITTNPTSSSISSYHRHPPLSNLCCVGSECGPFLRTRVRNGTVSNVVVNHPEPPTQTYGAYAMDLEAIANGGDGGMEEPAHMLHSDTLYEIAQCLTKGNSLEGGQLTIVTDNRWYANLICCTVVKLMRKHPGLLHSGRSDVTDSLLRRVEEFPIITSSSRTTEDTTAAATPRVTLYEGRPNEFIERVTRQQEQQREPRTGEGGGSSYFDRLWRSGAGTHAETKRRFVIYLTTSRSTMMVRRNNGSGFLKSGGGISSKSDNRIRPQSKRKVPYKAGSGRGGVDQLETMKKNKKRSDEKQKKRNAKRLLKKKGQQQEQL